MDKKQLQKILKLAEDIQKKEGEGAIYHLGGKGANAGVPRFSTGIEDLDEVLGGGLPKGRMIELFGAESSGKTSLAYHLCGLQELCLYIPVEGTFDIQRAKVFGNRPKQMLVYRNCTFAEDVMEKAMQFAELGIPLIVIDSVPFMIPKRQYETTMKDLEKTPQIGMLASFLARTLKPLNDVIEKSGTTIIFINQLRDKIDAMPFGEQTKTTGGRALLHAMSVRIQIARKGWIEIPNKNPYSSATNEKIGLISKFKIVKSKVCNPYGECEVPLFFERGYESYDDLKEVRAEILKANSAKYKKVGKDES